MNKRHCDSCDKVMGDNRNIIMLVEGACLLPIDGEPVRIEVKSYVDVGPEGKRVYPDLCEWCVLKAVEAAASNALGLMDCCDKRWVQIEEEKSPIKAHEIIDEADSQLAEVASAVESNEPF